MILPGMLAAAASRGPSGPAVSILSWSVRGGRLLGAAGSVPAAGEAIVDLGEDGGGTALGQSDTAHRPIASTTAMPGIVSATMDDGRYLETAATLAGATGALLVVFQPGQVSDAGRTLVAVPGSDGAAVIRLRIRAEEVFL